MKQSTLVKKFNKKFCVVLDGDKARVFIDQYDTQMKRQHYKSVSVQTFRELYEAGQVDCGTNLNGQLMIKTPANSWLSSTSRREFLNGVVFDPSGQQYAGILNLWRGFSVEPKEGDWEIIKNHILTLVCKNDIDLYSYIIGWIATTIQHPDKQTRTALVLKGKKGTGKGIIGHLIRSLFGSHGLHITSANHLTGKFNNHLKDCAFLFVDEALYANDKQHESILKGLITEDVITIEGKGVNAYQSRNMLSLIMASNEDWVIPASSDERRYCVADMSDEQLGNNSYYDALVDACQTKSVKQAMLYEMLNCDLSEFNVSNIPDTEGLKTQRLESLDSLGKWWVIVLEKGIVYESFNNDIGWLDVCTTSLLRASYLKYCNEQKLTKYDIKDERELGKFLATYYTRKRSRKILPIGVVEGKISYSKDKSNNWGYELGTHDNAIKSFCDIARISINKDDY